MQPRSIALLFRRGQTCLAGVSSMYDLAKGGYGLASTEAGVLQCRRICPRRYPVRHARRHHGGGRVRHVRRKAVQPDHQLDGEFHGPGEQGLITSEAKVTQLGKSIAFVEGKLTADDGVLLATASASTRLVEASKILR